MARVLLTSFSVVPGPNRDGVQMLHALKALGSRFSVDVLTVRSGELAYVERFLHTRMLRVPVPDGGLAARIDAFRRALLRQLEGAEYDVVHFRDAWSGVPVLSRRRALGYKTVFEYAGAGIGEPRPGDTRLLAELARDEEICFREADVITVATEIARGVLSNRFPDADIAVVPPGVDVDRFDDEPEEDATEPRVVYAGALRPGRGVRVLLRAMRDVVARTPSRLLLVGPIEEGFRDPLDAAIEQLGLAGRVDLAGAIDNEDLPRVLAHATVCVAPWAPDLADRPLAPFPTKLLEFMACRRATVAPRRTSVAELIDDGVEGLLFEPGNPRDLADKIVRLLLDRSLRERLADAGRRRVRERFPASATRRLLLETYRRILPPSTWSPPREAAPPVGAALTGAHTTGPSGLQEITLTGMGPVDDPLAGPPTTITAPPVPPTDDATGSTPRRAPDTDPWIVVHPHAATEGGRDRDPALEPDGTPVEGVVGPPASPMELGFVAGELEVAPAPDDLRFEAAGELLGLDDRPRDE